MSPTNIERLPEHEVRRVDPGKDENIKMGTPDAITVSCSPEDNETFVTSNLPQNVVKVTKYSSVDDRNGIQIEPGRKTSVSGPHIVEVTSHLFDESYRISHKKPSPRTEIGQIPKQPA